MLVLFTLLLVAPGAQAEPVTHTFTGQLTTITNGSGGLLDLTAPFSLGQELTLAYTIERDTPATEQDPYTSAYRDGISELTFSIDTWSGAGTPVFSFTTVTNGAAMSLTARLIENAPRLMLVTPRGGMNRPICIGGQCSSPLDLRLPWPAWVPPCAPARHGRSPHRREPACRVLPVRRGDRVHAAQVGPPADKTRRCANSSSWPNSARSFPGIAFSSAFDEKVIGDAFVHVQPSKASWGAIDSILAEKHGVCGFVLDKVNVPRLLTGIVEEKGFNIELPVNTIRPFNLPGGVSDSLTVDGRVIAVQTQLSSIRLGHEAIWYSAGVTMSSQ